MFNAWAVSPEADMALQGILRLFNKARAAGVEVFFITGRPDEQRAATARNLEAAGWKGLRLRYLPRSGWYKLEARQRQPITSFTPASGITSPNRELVWLMTGWWQAGPFLTNFCSAFQSSKFAFTKSRKKRAARQPPNRPSPIHVLPRVLAAAARLPTE